MSEKNFSDSNEIKLQAECPVNFYRLDKTKPYKAEGAAYTAQVNILIIFATVFFLVVVILLGVNCNSAFLDGGAIIAPIFMLVMGGVFLGLGIYSQIQNNRKRGEEEEIFKDCTLTDGRITYCDCVVRTVHHKNGTSHYYNVTLGYSFYDDKGRKRSGSYNHEYGYNPEFYKGQYLMIAFNDTDSLIMRKFTLIQEDEEIFLEQEAQRSSDDFDGITGELLDIDMTKPVKTAEYFKVWFWAALALIIFALIYSLAMGIFVIGRWVDFGHIVPDLVLVFGVYLMPVVLVSISAYFLYKYVGKKKHFEKIMGNNPYFTYGKLFASEKTFREGTRKKLLYCYIDKWGDKHTEEMYANALNKVVEDQTSTVVIAYDAQGNSVILQEYKFIGEN